MANPKELLAKAIALRNAKKGKMVPGKKLSPDNKPPNDPVAMNGAPNGDADQDGM